MPARSHKRSKRVTTVRRRKKRRVVSRVKGAKGVRVTKGRVSIKVPGHPGVSKLPASQLVRFVALNKLKAAAKKVLGHRGKKVKRKKKKHRKRRR
jgi:hypothetical protein